MGKCLRNIGLDVSLWSSNLLTIDGGGSIPHGGATSQAGACHEEQASKYWSSMAHVPTPASKFLP